MPSYSNQAAESTLLYEGAATTNYGTNNQLSFGKSGASQRRRSVIRFPSLPSGLSSVSNGILYLYSAAEALSVARDINIYRVKRAWVEGEATWNIYSTGNNWGTAGAEGAADFDSTSIGSATVSATIAANAEVQISLNSTYLLEYLNAQATYAGGFVGWMYEGGTDTWNPHSNDAATSTYRPKLTFDYTFRSGGLYWFM